MNKLQCYIRTKEILPTVMEDISDFLHKKYCACTVCFEKEEYFEIKG